MLDTKLKNRHKLAVFIMILTVLIPSIAVVDKYGEAFYERQQKQDAVWEEVQVSEEFVGRFVEACYVLYNREVSDGSTSGAGASESSQDVFPFGISIDDYEYFETYLDYRVVDEHDTVVSKTMAASSDRYPEEGNLSSYGIGMVISFDAKGTPSAVIRQGEYKEEQSRILNRQLSHFFEETELGRWFQANGNEDMIETPANRTYYLAMRQDNITEYLQGEDNLYYLSQTAPEWFDNMILLFMVAVAGVALLLPGFKSLRTGEEKIFTVPFEIAAVVLLSAVAFSVDIAEERINDTGNYDGIDIWIWVVVFSLVYWSVACMRRIFTMGVKRYFKECTLTVPAVRYIKRTWKAGADVCRGWFDRLYHSFDNLDFSEKSNKTILKLVLLNFAVLFVVTCMWFIGIFALIIYSVLLFGILRKYFNDLRDKYAVLLKATNRMAQGDLDVEITEDLGVFNPFKTEIDKIQEGYQKAVEKEVKSQRMKTELVTNVSHDLKTPLTAIITYVNLLKDEKDEEKRRDYIDVLERKSLRLKVLIEDLFELSKAGSKNITLNLVNVDVVNLFKQVRLEYAEKFEEAHLDFRCTYPQEKLTAELDSQKTYRIFENLLINVAKYALPQTRVYVKIEKRETEVVLNIMNISAAELNFNADEITERFVRGDASRNTEGSGLGLAIAKSFTELQKGRFRVETEGDLFKAEVAFPAV